MIYYKVTKEIMVLGLLSFTNIFAEQAFGDVFPSNGRGHGQLVRGKSGASIARSKAVDSAIDSHALGGLKTGGVSANSTGSQTEV